MIYSIIIANKFVNFKLIKTLKSIFIQKHLNETEVIIVNKDPNNKLNHLTNIFPNINFKIINGIDKNISDAFNKGLKLATNKYVYFIGSGDTFYDCNVLKSIKKYTNQKETQLIIGKVVIIDNKKKYLSKIFNNKLTLLTRLSIPHQGLFMKKGYFIKYGNFDTKLKYAMDYDLILRSFYNFPNFKSVDKIICTWPMDGIGKNKTLKILKEYDLIRRKNKILNLFIQKMIYNYSKVKFYLKQFLN
jgi:hypothetical protein|tara:strand:+ start:12865 stop:13599 length:735 start_codon:yes stop_codon:yes gene_type:complete